MNPKVAVAAIGLLTAAFELATAVRQQQHQPSSSHHSKRH